MSTKIYNAYKWNSTIENLLEFLKSLQPKVWAWKKEILVGAIRNLEKDLLLDHIKNDSYQGLNSPFNVLSSSVVYINQGKFYVQFFDVDSKFLDSKNLKDFHYQNQVDKPEDITDCQWEKRRKIWSEIFKTGRPSDDGFTYDFISVDNLYRFSYYLYN